MITMFAVVSEDKMWGRSYRGLFLSLEKVIETIRDDIHEFMDNPEKTLELSTMNSELIGHGTAIEPKCGFTYAHGDSYYWIYQYEMDIK